MRGNGGLAFSIRASGTEHRLHARFGVVLEALARGVECLLIEQHVFPLTGGELRFWVDRPIDERDQIARRKSVRDVRHAQIGDAETALGMMAREAPDGRASPIMSYPNRFFAAERVEQF